jgi:hypothetical protein
MKSLRILSLALALPVAAMADDVTEYLDAARTAYNDGNFSEALSSLDTVGQLIRQKKAEAVMKVLPNAPSGWKAEEPESDGTAAGLMGGMVSAKREYTKGDARIEIQVQSDSPLLQAMVSMFSNPMLLSAGGAKLELVKGTKYAITYNKESKSGEAKAVIDNRYIVSINGNDVTREELVSFAQALNAAALAKLK